MRCQYRLQIASAPKSRHSRKLEIHIDGCGANQVLALILKCKRAYTSYSQPEDT